MLLGAIESVVVGVGVASRDDVEDVVVAEVGSAMERARELESERGVRVRHEATERMNERAVLSISDLISLREYLSAHHG